MLNLSPQFHFIILLFHLTLILLQITTHHWSKLIFSFSTLRLFSFGFPRFAKLKIFYIDLIIHQNFHLLEGLLIHIQDSCFNWQHLSNLFLQGILWSLIANSVIREAFKQIINYKVHPVLALNSVFWNKSILQERLTDIFADIDLHS